MIREQCSISVGRMGGLGFVAMCVLACGADAQGDLPQVPGCTVEVYAELNRPGDLTFDDLGNLYVGNGESTGFIRRIPPGGIVVENYGETHLTDPDTVLFDAEGVISGTVGSILVGGGSGGGNIWAIRPDQSIVLVFGPTDVFNNPADMVFDSTGRFLLSDLDGDKRNVLASTGDFPAVLFTVPASPQMMAIDADDHIFTKLFGGVIQIHDTDGSLLDDAFVTDLPEGNVPIEFGPGGSWESGLYAVTGTNLVRIDEQGESEVIGTGFEGSERSIFGPDRALYVSQLNVPSAPEDRILRIVPLCPADLHVDGVVNVIDLIVVLSNWGPCPPEGECPGDIDDDGVVGVLDLVALLSAWGLCP